jgi:hypothetical protein
VRQPTTAARDDFAPFGLDDQAFDAEPADKRGVRIVNLTLRQPRRPGPEKDRGAAWLRYAMLALALLAATAAAVSYEAQYVLVRAVKHAPVIAALQAGIPDVGAAVFACLGIALSLQGKRAVRARALNLGCVAVSVTMNALAAHGGWRPLAVWVMAPALYALASDTLIGVIRAWSLARQRGQDTALADDEATPLAALGGLLLWLLRLALAPPSTLSGFRRWVIAECPVAPGRRQAPISPAAAAALPAAPIPVVGQTKTARFLALVAERHGPLAQLPLGQVGQIAAELAPEAELHPGSARSVLRKRILQAQAGSTS